jgi:hypothetical protein
MQEDAGRQMRYEIKMTCEEVYLPLVRSLILLHPAGFSEAYPPRQVNNIYLDTPALDCLNDHIDGAVERSKLRFRWYGPDHAAVRGILELKRKVGHLGWKEYSPVAATFDLTAIAWEEWLNVLREHAQDAAAHWLAWRDRPALLNNYMREYYESADGEIRITLDYDQAVYEQVMYLRPNLTLPTPVASCTVVEVKATPDQYQQVSNVLSSLPLQVEHNSKYVSGMIDALCFI